MDRVRETLFNWLASDCPGARVLDCFAGSGALGFEAMSRGARRLTAMESDAAALENLRSAAARLGDDGMVGLIFGANRSTGMQIGGVLGFGIAITFQFDDEGLGHPEPLERVKLPPGQDIHLAIEVQDQIADFFVNGELIGTERYRPEELRGQIGLMIQDAEVNRIFMEGSDDRESLSAEDRNRFDAMAAIWFNGWNQEHQFAADAVIGPLVWNSRRRAILRMMNLPGIESWWREWRDTYSDEFTEFIDGLVREGGPAE